MKSGVFVAFLSSKQTSKMPKCPRHQYGVAYISFWTNLSESKW